jgi:hypothetical protein
MHVGSKSVMIADRVTPSASPTASTHLAAAAIPDEAPATPSLPFVLPRTYRRGRRGQALRSIRGEPEASCSEWHGDGTAGEGEAGSEAACLGQLSSWRQGEQAWQRAAQVGINQTRKELGVSDRALRTAWQHHGLGLRPRPTATPTTPQLDPAFVALNRGLLPARERSSGELAAWVRRDEEYATLGAEVVVELNSESRTRRPTARAWAIIRRAHRAHQRTSDRQQRGERRQVNRASRTDRTGRSPAQLQEREVVGGAH